MVKNKNQPKNAPVDIKWWRRQLETAGMSQNRLAKKLGILVGGLSRRVNGHLDFKAVEVSALSRLFGVSLAEVQRELVEKPQRQR